MTTTQLIKLLKSVERGGASGESREISFYTVSKGRRTFISTPVIEIDSTGDGIAGAQLTLRIVKQV